LRLVGLSYLAFALPVAGVALSHSFALSLGLYAVAGLINVVQLVATTSWVQEVTAPEMLGRVFAVRRTFGNISVLVTTLLGGFLADRVGLPPVLFVGAFITLVTGLVAFFLPGLRASSRDLMRRATAAAATAATSEVSGA
ncbi:MAG: MFS transporter, partial [Bacillota bacterium]